ncbi:Initiator Replication protein [compost metagenome]
MLHSKVTTYDLRRVANLESSHSFRFFEMLMQFRSTGWAYIEVDSLRIALGLGEAYQRFNNLRQRVIDPAINELKEKSGLEITYELKSAGRKVTAIKFMFRDTLQMPLALDDPNKIGVSFPEVVPATEDEGEWTLTRPLGELAQEQMDEFIAVEAVAG